ncbi:MAG: hypothetical protein D3926_15975 [Desulfobacteraceae bacterium]|nr:MAG: hypothetical protein D3926_15975 [Desulfobacteraceae bacterium]
MEKNCCPGCNDALTKTPWQSREDWNQVLMSFRVVESKENVSHLKDTAARIGKCFAGLATAMDELCSHTCPDCKEICCTRANIWFDFKDLLYSYFGTGRFPESQIRKTYREMTAYACSCLAPNGCTLPRTERPFVCTWYICPDQKAFLTHHFPNRLADLDRALINIKALRDQLEHQFIRLCLES